jgi:hypothetical protein
MDKYETPTALNIFTQQLEANSNTKRLKVKVPPCVRLRTSSWLILTK